MLHPEFLLNINSLETVLPQERQRRFPFTITNDGNGELIWSAEKRLLGDANADPLSLRQSLPVSQITGDDRIEGVAFGNQKIFLSGANGEEANLIYVFNRDGEMIDQFPQVGSSRYGYKDMEWDGEFLWGAGQDTIFVLTEDGEVVNRFDDPLNPSQYIAIDRDNGVVYLSGVTTSIIRCDRDGNILDGSLNRQGMRIYGLSYWPEDPDGFNLYIVNRPGGDGSKLAKMNVETGDTVTVMSYVEAPDATGQQSLAIANDYDIYSWVMFSIQNIPANFGGDRLDIHQLDNRKEWMEIDQYEGTIQAGQAQDLVFTFDATDLEPAVYQGEIVFTHNAVGHEAHLEVTLEVIDGQLRNFHLLSPADGDTVGLPPPENDTAQVASLNFAWEEPPRFDENEQFSYLLWFRADRWMTHFVVSDTSNLIRLDTIGLPPVPLDVSMVWWVEAATDQDTFSCLEPFTLHLRTLSAQDARPVPVEFGLSAVYPNPFNSSLMIEYGISEVGPSKLAVYDMQGREVKRLYTGTPEIGRYRVEWDATGIVSGIYLVRIESVGRSQTVKTLLLR